MLQQVQRAPDIIKILTTLIPTYQTPREQQREVAKKEVTAAPRLSKGTALVDNPLTM